MLTPPVIVTPGVIINATVFLLKPQPNALDQQHCAYHSHHFADSVHGVVHTQNAGTQQHNGQLKCQ
jgi:hypothetical protein